MIGPPVQLAYAVDDVVEAASRWAARGVGPFVVSERIALSSARVHGVEAGFDHSSAYAWWGTVMVELIQQHDGGDRPIVGTSGLHHVARFVDDLGAAQAELVAAGHDEVLHAVTEGALAFAFHDTRAELGHLTELYERDDRLLAFYASVEAAAAGWDGTDPVRRR